MDYKSNPHVPLLNLKLKCKGLYFVCFLNIVFDLLGFDLNVNDKCAVDLKFK